MRLYPECGPCMMQRVLLFCEDEDEETRMEVVKAVSKLYAEKFDEEYTTARLAYERNQIVERITGNRDPMKKPKEESFNVAMKLYPKLKEHVDKIKDDRERFNTALRIALAGNILEFGARDHTPDLNTLEEDIFKTVNEKPFIDDSDKIYERIKEAKKILYVTDNTAELVMDSIFIEELDKYAQVEIAPLSRPIQDDASIEETRKAGLDRNHKIIPRGDSIGIWLEKTTKEFQNSYEKADFIIAKGMGCYETLVDYPERNNKTGLLMKVKCLPVSRDIKAPVSSSIVKLL